MGRGPERRNEFCLVMEGELDEDPNAPELVRSLTEICVNGGVYEVMLVLVSPEGVSRSGKLHDALMQLPPPKIANVMQEDSLTVAVKKWKPNYVYHAPYRGLTQIIERGRNLFLGPFLDSEMYIANNMMVVELFPEVRGAIPVRVLSTPGEEEFRGRTLYLATSVKSKKDSP